MRLVCPNCDAEYEVDAQAIPLTGRDVQCSNCGHGWFQTHPEIEMAAEIAAVTQKEEIAPPEPPAIAEPEPVPEVAREPAVAARPSRSLDETVLAVLREEAEREAAARRAEAAVPPRVPVIETQTEMPLTQDHSGMSAAVRRIARLRGGEPEPVAPPPPPKSRREMLPAIEEINSTLRATSDRTSYQDAAIQETMADAAQGGAFRRGFLTLVGLAVVVVVLYVLAPVIANNVPGMSGFMAAYVGAVNTARVWLDTELRALIGALRGMAAGQGG